MQLRAAAAGRHAPAPASALAGTSLVSILFWSVITILTDPSPLLPATHQEIEAALHGPQPWAMAVNTCGPGGGGAAGATTYFAGYGGGAVFEVMRSGAVASVTLFDPHDVARAQAVQ